MKIIAIIFAALCRIATEYGLPIVSIFVFHWPAVVTIWAVFLTWQILSIVYLGPILKKQQEDLVKAEVDYAVSQVLTFVRSELVGRLPAADRVEIADNVSESWKRMSDDKNV